MTNLDPRISSLKSQHQELEEDLTEKMKHPSVDGHELTTIKKRKLAIKDEIASLKRRQ